MDVMNKIFSKAKDNPKKIVFPEALEPRILMASKIILSQKLANIVLLGDVKRVLGQALKYKLPLKNLEIIDPRSSQNYDLYWRRFYEIRKQRKDNITTELAKKIINDPIYFGTMMVHQGHADGLISGSTHPTAQTIRPALQIFKSNFVSSFFLMILKNKKFIYADCGLNINPNSEELAQIAIDSAESARLFGLKPKIALLSFSTKGSARHAFVDKVVKAKIIVNKIAPNLDIDGELQVDAAIVPKVARIKCPDSTIKGDANVLIFPDLQSGNIAYKLTERLAGAKALGPLMQGLPKPVNDLSRGCSVQDIIDVTAITVVQAQR